MPTSEAELRELLDDIVWGQSVDPYAEAIGAIEKSWYIYPWVLNQLHVWARQKTQSTSKRAESYSTSAT